MSRVPVVAAVLLAALAVACSGPPPETLVLDGTRLTVHNRTDEEWTNVEIWVNHYFRFPARSIEAGGRFQVGLDQFVDAYGRRFERGRLTVDDLRLKAKRPNGEPLEIVKEFPKEGLAGALGGKK